MCVSLAYCKCTFGTLLAYFGLRTFLHVVAPFVRMMKPLHPAPAFSNLLNEHALWFYWQGSLCVLCCR